MERTPDHRRHPRTCVSLPVKLRPDDGPFRYLSGRTDNLSAGGALFHVASSSRLRPGQRVLVGIAATPRQAMLHADRFVPATILRAASLGHSQTLAIRFDRPQASPAVESGPAIAA